MTIKGKDRKEVETIRNQGTHQEGALSRITECSRSGVLHSKQAADVPRDICQELLAQGTLQLELTDSPGNAVRAGMGRQQPTAALLGGVGSGFPSPPAPSCTCAPALGARCRAVRECTPVRLNSQRMLEERFLSSALPVAPGGALGEKGPSRKLIRTSH